jgi:methylthioribose-1-phosphate isomerase
LQIFYSSPNFMKRTIWLKPDNKQIVQVLDQRQLPHEIVVCELSTWQEVETAIKDMTVRGAPLIGATAAYGVYLACLHAVGEASPEAYLARAFAGLRASRPTAINLFWALDRMQAAVDGTQDWKQKVDIAQQTAQQIVEQDVAICYQIGTHGLALLEAISKAKNGAVVNILTHCNAGRLGCIEWGTATAPIYLAHQLGVKVHVWVDETRPRNQGASLTAWELGQAGVPHTIVTDNTGGHLMQHAMVDIVFVGTDRTTRTGDVANKIGTYLKALAAKDNQVPFYVALPSSTIDWTISDGVAQIPIEERSQDEVRYITGKAGNGSLQTVLLTPEASPALNYGFDVTPARLVTGLITERGVCEANEAGLKALFPEK